METLREQLGLTALRVGYTGSGGRGGRLTCEVRSPQEPVDAWEVPADAIGLLTGRPGADDDVEAELAWCRDRLARSAAVARLRSHGEPLWLAVTPEHPVLPAVDWETGLAALGLPVLRLPARLGSPTASPHRPRVAVCVSAPRATGTVDAGTLVEGALAAMRAQPGPTPEVHLFADAGLTPPLRQLDGVTVHDPPVHDPAVAPDDAPRTGDDREPAPTGRPWPDWISRTFDGSSLDVLHLIGHGALAADQGGFAVAERPDRDFDRGSARILWPQQIATLMTSTGAWGLVVTVAPRNYSSPGLRLLAARVAAMRSAATVVHEPERGGPPDQLEAAYRILLDHPTSPPPDTRGLTVTVHPGRVGVGEPDRAHADAPAPSDLGALVDAGFAVPGWMVGARRQVAQWETQLSVDADTEQARAARAGLEMAKERLDVVIRDALDPGGAP